MRHHHPIDKEAKQRVSRMYKVLTSRSGLIEDTLFRFPQEPPYKHTQHSQSDVRFTSTSLLLLPRYRYFHLFLYVPPLEYTMANFIGIQSTKVFSPEPSGRTMQNTRMLYHQRWMFTSKISDSLNAQKTPTIRSQYRGGSGERRVAQRQKNSIA